MVSAEEDTPSEYQRGEGYVVSTWRNVLLMLWSGAVTIEALDATSRAGVMIEKRYGDQVAVSISLPKVALPDQEVRAYAARLMRERSDAVRVSVTVIEGDGFWLSAGRMVMTALVTLSGAKTRPIIAKSVDEAVPLIHPHVQPKATVAEVVRALRVFRG